MSIVLYFIPAILSLHLAVKDKPMNTLGLLSTYAFYVVVLNLFNFALILVLSPDSAPTLTSEISISFAFKYLSLSFLMSLILPLIINALLLNIKLEITNREAERRRHEKTE